MTNDAARSAQSPARSRPAARRPARQDNAARRSIRHLADECAYEHWHRMLFARFLAENDLLIEPESGVALSLDECREFAREKRRRLAGSGEQFRA